MALPTPDNLKTLDYAYMGQPFCNVAAKSTVVLAGMDVSYLGQPFVANEGALGTNMQINIGDAWKTVTKIQINIGDVWKTVTKIQINIGDTWKTIF